MANTKISRQLHFIHLLLENQNGISKEIIVSEIIRKFKILDIEYAYLDLTFKRDLKELRNEFNLEIHYNSKDKLYKIDEEFIENDEDKLRLLTDSFHILNSLDSYSGFPNFVIPENRKSSGKEWFSDIKNAISLQNIIRFDYFKYDSQSFDQKKIKPFALKESKNRWYVIGSYENQKQIRSFGLDRISNLLIQTETYKSKNAISVKEIKKHYKNSFAMFVNSEIEDIVLKFDLRDGNYIKSYPIHASQIWKISEDGTKAIVDLKLKITEDFVMELLSRSWSVEVIKPLSLRKKMKEIFIEALSRNS